MRELVQRVDDGQLRVGGGEQCQRQRDCPPDHRLTIVQLGRRGRRGEEGEGGGEGEEGERGGDEERNRRWEVVRCRQP